MAKELKERLETKFMVQKLLQELVVQIPVKSILEECLTRSVWLGEAGKLWNILREDIELQEDMERRISQARKERRLKASRVMEKERVARMLKKKVSEELWKRKRTGIILENEVETILSRIQEWRPFCIMTGEAMEWAVKEAVEHEELNGMDCLTMASLEEVEDDFWTVIKVAKTIPDDDYVMTEPLDTTTTYEEWLAVELAEMGIDMDMETTNTMEEDIELEDVVMGIEKEDDDICITEQMGRPKTQESMVPGRLNFWDSHRGQVGRSYVCGEKDNNELEMAAINITFKMGTWYLKSWIKNHSVEYESNDLCTHPVQSKHNIWKSICAIYEGCHCLVNQTAAKRLYTYISCGAVPSLTGGYYNCAEDKIS
jgi:hypothetical protein